MWREWSMGGSQGLDRRKASMNQVMTRTKNRVFQHGCEKMASRPGSTRQAFAWEMEGIRKWPCQAGTVEDCDDVCATAAALTRMALSTLTAPLSNNWGISDVTAIVQQSYVCIINLCCSEEDPFIYNRRIKEIQLIYRNI